MRAVFSLFLLEKCHFSITPDFFGVKSEIKQKKLFLIIPKSISVTLLKLLNNKINLPKIHGQVKSEVRLTYCIGCSDDFVLLNVTLLTKWMCFCCAFNLYASIQFVKWIEFNWIPSTTMQCNWNSLQFNLIRWFYRMSFEFHAEKW